MKPLKNQAQDFLECLKDAEQILEDYPSLRIPSFDVNLKYAAPEHFDLALFEQWSEVCEPETLQKPPVRVIQHLSCTGGTLISKCLAAMPNVSLLSEVNPLSPLIVDEVNRFAPADLTYLAAKSKFPRMDELSGNIFRAGINATLEHLLSLGRYLVIREHSHSDFLVGETTRDFCTVRELLKEEHSILSVLTVRHPVDSYLSLLNNEWMRFSPTTFDEYCRRYLLFIGYNEEIPKKKYEDFVIDPMKEMKSICEILNLPFNEDFQDLYDLFIFSGDSGRTSPVISKRKRRKISGELREEIEKSSRYFELCEELGYEPSID